jgi:hypothetical protein
LSFWFFADISNISFRGYPKGFVEMSGKSNVENLPQKKFMGTTGEIL